MAASIGIGYMSEMPANMREREEGQGGAGRERGREGEGERRGRERSGKGERRERGGRKEGERKEKGRREWREEEGGGGGGRREQFNWVERAHMIKTFLKQFSNTTELFSVFEPNNQH